MSKLYKAVDRNYPEYGLKCWLVNDEGVAVSTHRGDDEKEITVCQDLENVFVYDSIERFNDAIDPVLITEW
nr:MAG TPA: hypothetical protein [Caudoviricetes sp.]